jgi:uncharacterized membrane-anchored protein
MPTFLENRSYDASNDRLVSVAAIQAGSRASPDQHRRIVHDTTTLDYIGEELDLTVV